jgi:glycosyltransferase involved in cell wall biosynthesis
MKIVFVCARYYPSIGGVERHVEEISERLRAKEHEVIIVSEDEAHPFGKPGFMKKFRIWFYMIRHIPLFLSADASFVVDVTNWSLGVGYDTNYSNAKLQKGHVHAGMSLMLSDNLYIDAHYRLQTQEWSADNWNGGLRMIW